MDCVQCQSHPTKMEWNQLRERKVINRIFGHPSPLVRILRCSGLSDRREVTSRPQSLGCEISMAHSFLFPDGMTGASFPVCGFYIRNPYAWFVGHGGVFFLSDCPACHVVVTTRDTWSYRASYFYVGEVSLKRRNGRAKLV